MRSEPLAVIVLALLSSLAIAGSEDQQAWESPFPIDKVQRMVKDLEADPLGEHAESGRAILVTYFDNMRPEFSVCLDQFLPVFRSKKKSINDLWFYVPIASGSYLLDHPEDIDDKYAYQLAGLEGMLRAYESMIASKPKLRHEYLDDLLQRRDTGKLGEHVKNHMCDDGGSSSNNRLNLTKQPVTVRACARPAPERFAG